ncbi:MAG: rolling circle replication-associated protein [Verrucomicrobiia bacterium]
MAPPQPRASGAGRVPAITLLFYEQLSREAHGRRRQAMMKARLAVQWTVEALASCKGGATFWTFTFPSPRFSEKECAALWVRLRKALLRRFACIGIRVFERHESGAWHVHAVIRGKLPVVVVRAICIRYGFGRVNVKRVKRGLLGTYLAKYMTKANRKGLNGVRLWATFWKRSLWEDVRRVRCKDIEADSRAKRCYRILKQLQPTEIPRVLFRKCRLLCGRCAPVVHGSREECYAWCVEQGLRRYWVAVWVLTQGIVVAP